MDCYLLIRILPAITVITASMAPVALRAAMRAKAARCTASASPPEQSCRPANAGSRKAAGVSLAVPKSLFHFGASPIKYHYLNWNSPPNALRHRAKTLELVHHPLQRFYRCSGSAQPEFHLYSSHAQSVFGIAAYAG